MATVRTVVNLGRALRKRSELKVRQPLSQLTVVTRDDPAAQAVRSHQALIAQELNVRSVAVERHETDLVHLSARANFKSLGPRFGPRTKEIAVAIERLSHEELDDLLNGNDIEVAGEPIGSGDVVVAREPREGVVVAAEGAVSVALDTELSEELVREGVAREIINRIQALRRDADFAVSDRIVVRWHSPAEAVAAAFTTHADLIAEETLATALDDAESASGTEVEIGGKPLWLTVERSAPTPSG
jgi:isoleucyl-tRNA synthetase